jgi:hypothetical protein
MSAKLPLLSPYKRELLLDALRPPSGYRLDCAVGTCFSLDLMSALVVPLALAVFDDETSGGAAGDPTAILAAAQTQAERISIYCEAGRIAPSAQAPSALAYLERSLHEVKPPGRGSFHPKLWVLRYASHADEDAKRHRILCLSRNLTLDRSWDTILMLEEGQQVRSQTEPVADFLRYLHRQSASAHARDLARTIATVSFAPPPGFRRLRFLSVGALGADDPMLRGGDRLMILSPFIDARRLEWLSERWTRVDLASRGEALDRISPEVLTSLGGSLYVFDGLNRIDPDGGRDEAEVQVTDERLGESIGLSGLHAKVHSAARGDEASLLIGSANATSAGFQRNVEFCVELSGSKNAVGPRALQKAREDKSGLSVLLGPYTRRDEPTEPSREEQELERLETIRREIARVRLVAEVRKRGEEGPWDVALKARDPLPSLSAKDTLRCWPVTLSAGTAERVGRRPVLARFRFSSLANVTPYFSFALSTRMRGVPDVRFTLTANLEGDIQDRLDRVLGDMLRDPEKFIRFLLLLLASGDDEGVPLDPHGAGNGNGGPNGDPIRSLDSRVPLLEVLLRTFARDPGRLDTFRTAIRHIRSAEERGMDVPTGLLEIWEPVEQALNAQKRQAKKGSG